MGEMTEQEMREAFHLLDLISCEFRSDPTSVQCFDLRVIVERVNYLAQEWNRRGRP